MAKNSDDLLTFQQVAEMLHLSRAKVYDLMNEGRLTPATPDNPLLDKQRRRFRRADVERVLREGRKPPSQPAAE